MAIVVYPLLFTRRVKRRTKGFLPRKGNEPLNLRHDWKPEIVT